MDPSQDFKSLQEKVQASLVSTTKTVTRVASEDLGFQRTVNPATSERLEEQSTRLLSLSSNLLKAAAKTTDQKSVGDLDDVEDVDIQWRSIVDVIDGLLEKADICLDEYTGLVKRKGDFPDPGPQKKSKTTDRLEYSVWRANIIKPQNGFEKKVDNFAQGPWKPLLTSKPHATVPLEHSLGISVNENNQSQYKHPYETEILNLKYPASVYEKRDPVPYQPIETTSATWVDTYEGVLAMLEELKEAKEIAIDLEHHDYRSYHGLLSLMQISTREKDWVIDTLKPWRHKLEILNEVFADPKILKVFHGAFMDTIWLQRDLGLYIVGLFDTYHASSSLEYSSRSLAYLLKAFVDFDADKKYQMADWRIRPLPEEMFYYARSDTHFLLYIYDHLRNELISKSDRSDPQKDLIELALQKSKDTSLDRYTPFSADPETGEGARGWLGLLQKSYARLTGEQLAVLRAVHKWRDDLARIDDENPQYIMPQQAMMEIAKVLPGDPKALHSLLGNNSCQKAKRSVDELFGLVREARKAGVDGPNTTEFFRSRLGGSSVAAVANREFGKGQPDLPSLEELRSNTSQLWGSIPISSLWDGSSQSPKGAAKELISLPWTTFVQDAVFAATEEEIKPKARDQDVDMIPLEDTKNAAHPPEKEVDVDNTEFTLRSGRKRKIEEVQAEESDSEDGEGGVALETQEMISLNDDEEKKPRNQRKREKKEAQRRAKGENKAEKTRKREEKGAARKRKEVEQQSLDKQSSSKPSQNEEDEGEDAPFDYSKAQSVLHAQRTTVAADANGDAKGRKKAFDPYTAKMNAEGPKPARRMHGERPGKTVTFKK